MASKFMNRILTKGSKSGPCIAIRSGATFLFLDYAETMESLAKIAKEGFTMLQHRLHAIDVVEETIKLLEENSIFNCGFGAVANEKGFVENHASIMHGKRLQAGCVSNVNGSRHPISIARAIMERAKGTCFLAGEAASDFARINRVPVINARKSLFGIAGDSNATDKDDTKTKKSVTCIDAKRKPPISQHRSPRRYGKECVGGVGVVVMDTYGNISAGASTGGCLYKVESSICGEHLIGCGLFAENQKGAVTVSGECKHLTTSCAACRLIEAKDSTAAWNLLHTISHRSDTPLGAIHLDRTGQIHIYTLRGQMPWCAIRERECIHSNYRGGHVITV